MQKKLSSPQCKMDISGIKCSRELIQFNWMAPANNIVPELSFFHWMTENRINISFMGIGTDKDKVFSFCCVETEYFGQIHQKMQSDPEMFQHAEILNSVGTLTIFPHQSSFKLLGLVLAQLGKSGIPIYGIGTSISALTFSTQYSLLNKSINYLNNVLNLPSNHAPFRPEFCVKQI